LSTPVFTGIQLGGQQVNLGFEGIPLGSYRVQWTSNLPAGTWNTLFITNSPASGGVLPVTDQITSNETQRFYRIQTPP
jgi:hypothetical protein